MKRIFALLLVVCMLTGCGAKEEVAEPVATTQATEAVAETIPQETYPLVADADTSIAYTSRFDSLTEIALSDEGITVNGNQAAVSTSHDIIYYEDKDAYESGYPYGEGESWERHSQAEAESHTVVNITEPGAYKLTGKLSAGQIRVDLGATAYDDPDAVVELILENTDITCTVAPAILFANVYECDGAWSTDTAKAEVDTTAAGANLVIEGENTVNGSHVAKIYKDKEGEKKLWKQDGAIYSYMSMNVFGPGKLDITADNEGLDTELHLTINGGDIAIRADNDGINTNEDGVSVTTINGGNIHIIAGLGAEGDGIDSNGYLVINGGSVVSAANPMADAGLDSDMGSFIHGGSVIALGSTMDWAESDSQQVTMNLQFAQQQSSDAAVVVTREDGTVIFAYDPSADEVLADNSRVYSGAVISCANVHVGETYHVYVDGEVTGTDVGGMYDVTTVSGYTGGIQMAYTGTDVMGGPGGMGFGGMNFGGQMPEGMEDFEPGKGGGQMPNGMEPPEGKERPSGMPSGQMPGGMDKGQIQIPANMEGFDMSKIQGQIQEGMENFDFSQIQLPEGMEDMDMSKIQQQIQEGMADFDFSQIQPPEGMEDMEMSQFGGMFGFGGGVSTGEPSTSFYMQDKVNFFSGLSKAA